jgi:hypothetical protein
VSNIYTKHLNYNHISILWKFIPSRNLYHPKIYIIGIQKYSESILITFSLYVSKLLKGLKSAKYLQWSEEPPELRCSVHSTSLPPPSKPSLFSNYYDNLGPNSCSCGGLRPCNRRVLRRLDGATTLGHRGSPISNNRVAWLLAW